MCWNMYVLLHACKGEICESVCQLHSMPEKVIQERAFTAVVGFGKMTKKDKGLPAVVGNFFNP